MLTLNVAQIDSPDVAVVAAALQEKIAALPRMLSGMPLFLEMSDESLDVGELLRHLHDRQVLPAGMLGGSSRQIEQARACGLATATASLMPGNQRGREAAASVSDAEPAHESPQNTDEAITEDAVSAENAPVAATQVESARSMLVTRPVRSGQQIYARGGDLIITTSVSAGAEVIADGSIHVYGALRGRALAGVQGDATARIFCSQLGAELVSIAGHYRVAEDLDARQLGRPVQIRLEGDKLLIERQGR